MYVRAPARVCVRASAPICEIGCVCVCVCLCDRQIDRERERERERIDNYFAKSDRLSALLKSHQVVTEQMCVCHESVLVTLLNFSRVTLCEIFTG